MAKMRTYTFYDGENVETKEATSYKKAVKSYQGGTKAQQVEVEWTTKKGEEFYAVQTLPIGRKIRQAAIKEKQRAALRAAKEARR